MKINFNFKKIAVKKMIGVVVGVVLSVGLVKVGVSVEDAKNIGTAAAAMVGA